MTSGDFLTEMAEKQKPEINKAGLDPGFAAMLQRMHEYSPKVHEMVRKLRRETYISMMRDKINGKVYN
jgi:hypothetical protein